MVTGLWRNLAKGVEAGHCTAGVPESTLDEREH